MSQLFQYILYVSIFQPFFEEYCSFFNTIFIFSLVYHFCQLYNRRNIPFIVFITFSTGTSRDYNMQRILHMKKINVQLLLLIFFTLGATFFTAMTLKAGIGTYACWDALSANVAQLTGLKVANFSIFMNLICVILQIFMLGKNFRPIMLFQIPFVIIFGMLVNFFYYNIITFELQNYFIRFIICILSITGVSFFLGALTSLNLVSLSVETSCNIASGKYSIDYAVLRVGIDAFCIVTSIILSFVFHLTFTIREGTFIAMFMLGPLEKKFMIVFRSLAKQIQKL